MINLEINGYKTLRETYLGLVTTELSVAVCKTLKMDRELDVLDELAVPSDYTWHCARAAQLCVRLRDCEPCRQMGVWTLGSVGAEGQGVRACGWAGI
jgi:hypothetical protein